METNDNQKPKPTVQTVSIRLDFRLVSAVLLAVVLGMLILWRPWDDPRSKDRTIEVTGTSKISAVPDEFVFTPSYQFKNSDKAAALAEVTKKSDEIVKKLKELGVADSKIKTNSSGYDYPIYYFDGDSKSTPTYTLSLTVTVTDKDLAQKVQDYLVTTSPLGAVSPQPNFSDAKRKELENKARDEATKEARQKAEQSAKNLGFGVGQVKQVTDGVGFGGIVYPARGMATDMVDSSAEKLSIQPGENDLSYTVTVVYYVR
jgi:uncharacterized protein